MDSNNLEQLEGMLAEEGASVLTEAVWLEIRRFLMNRGIRANAELAGILERLKLADRIVDETQARRSIGVVNLVYTILPANTSVECTEMTVVTVFVEQRVRTLNAHYCKLREG